MTLELKFAVDRASLRFQEDATCRLSVVNRGPAPVNACLPRLLDQGSLRLRTIDVKTGVEIPHAPPRIPGHLVLPLHDQPFPPGATHVFETSLLSLPRSLPAGIYEISAVFLYNQESERVESAPVRVEIRPTTPRNLFSLGGRGVWVNVNADPPEILHSTFDVDPEGGRFNVDPVGPASLRAEPACSDGRYPWIAWTQGSELSFSNLHGGMGASPVRSSPLSSPRDVLVGPLHGDPIPHDNSRPGGAALIYRGSGELETLKLAPEKATSLARAPLPGPRPIWITTFTDGPFKNIVLAAQAVGDKVVLLQSSWPGSPSPATRILGEWPGRFMGAGAAASKALDGTLYVRRTTWERISFRIDDKWEFTSTSSPGPEAPRFERFEAAPRVLGAGPAALLKTLDGAWWLYDGRTASPLPPELLRTPFPLDVTMMNRSLVLIAGFKDGGVQPRMADGRTFPIPVPSE